MASLPDHLQPTPIGRERLSREVVASYQRDRILLAATAVFAERGYHGTTIDQIVAAAHVGVGSFYEHFENKEACFVAAYDRVALALRDGVLAATSDDGPWRERLAAALRALLEAIEADPAAARLALVEVHSAGEAVLSHYERNLEEATEMLRVGRAQGSVSADLPQSLEFATVGGVSWYLQQRIEAGDATAASALLPELLEIVAEPYLAA
jgi:AcrR family transcriptional regulator